MISEHDLLFPSNYCFCGNVSESSVNHYESRFRICTLFTISSLSILDDGKCPDFHLFFCEIRKKSLKRRGAQAVRRSADAGAGT